MLGWMCAAIEYVFNEKLYIATPDTQASALPVRMRDGALMLVRWGGNGVHGARSAPVVWPAEPWMELEKIKLKAWADCDPMPVKIPATRFMVYLDLGVEVDHWVTVGLGEHLQGTLVR